MSAVCRERLLSGLQAPDLPARWEIGGALGCQVPWGPWRSLFTLFRIRSAVGSEVRVPLPTKGHPLTPQPPGLGMHPTEWPQPGLLRAARPTLLRFSIPEPSPCPVSPEHVLIVSAPSRNSTASFCSPAVHPPQPFPSSVCERTFHLDEGPGAGRWAPWGPTRPDLPGPWAHGPGCHGAGGRAPPTGLPCWTVGLCLVLGSRESSCDGCLEAGGCFLLCSLS